MSGLPHTLRPFRIWDDLAKKDLPHRCYTAEDKAREAAIKLLLWLKVGNTLTIYDSRSSEVSREFSKRLRGNEVVYIESE